ncbi:MAG: radical SAM protein [Bacillota bacterium]
MTKLLTEKNNYGDQLRYKKNSGQQNEGVSVNRGPVVVWNVTQACNLKCLHCYADSDDSSPQKELTTLQAEDFIRQLSDFKVPVLLFSGGEPLLRDDIFHLIDFSSRQGMRPVISTNGLLLTEKNVGHLQEAGIKYVGVSVDGVGPRNDEFRGLDGAFKQALEGIRRCQKVGLKVGLRFTINKYTLPDIKKVFALVKSEEIPRVCFYHLVYAGRGSGLRKAEIEDQQKREVIDLIIEKTNQFNRLGLDTEVLTVDNHADGIYTYLKYKKKQPRKADYILQMLKNNGGNRSGKAFGCVDWKGDVHPDQFTRQVTWGNVLQRDFADIWTDNSNLELVRWRNRGQYITGRCAECRWFDVCNGNLRARALGVYNDLWASDPGCYLTEAEIG